jgi:hypothetical protein
VSIEIKWTDEHPETGERRFLKAEKFAGEWQFTCRKRRRDVRWRAIKPTRAMWEVVLDGLQRRYGRREGVEESDVKEVERLLKTFKEPAAEEE